MTIVPACYGGCCVNPNFNPPVYPWWHLPTNYFTPTVFNTNDFVKLTIEEKEILKNLVDAFNTYCSLDKRSEADNREFTDSIHRLQQLIALQVARRVDIDVWKQPE